MSLKLTCSSGPWSFPTIWTLWTSWASRLEWLRPRFYDSFFYWLSFSRSQVVTKMTSFHFEFKKLSFDDFLMMNWEPEKKKNQKIRTLAYTYTCFVMFNFELLASDKAIMPFIYEKGQKICQIGSIGMHILPFQARKSPKRSALSKII